jgi:hypothetical protein
MGRQSGRWASIRRWSSLAVRPLGIYLASRAVTLAVLGTAAVVNPAVRFHDTVFRWDASWYLSVADHGYPHHIPTGVTGDAAQSSVAFFPGYPLTIRGLASVSGLSMRQSAVAVSFLAGAAAALAVWLLVRHLVDGEVADRATALFCFFPGAYVLSMAYAEGLMVALAAGCLLALVSGRWLVAGTLAALATATRPSAVALVAACAWEAARGLRARKWRPLAAALLAPAGGLAFFGFLWARTGDPGAWLTVQQNGWKQRIDFGRTTVDEAWQAVRDPTDINILVGALSIVFVVVAGYLLLRSGLPAVLSVYTAVLMFMAFASEFNDSRPRLILTAFPLIVALAWRTRGATFSAVLGSSAVLMAVLAVLSAATLRFTP